MKECAAYRMDHTNVRMVVHPGLEPLNLNYPGNYLESFQDYEFSFELKKLELKNSIFIKKDYLQKLL